jgi:hypothetical protein
MKPGGILNDAGSSLTISSIVTGTGLAFFTGPGDELKLLLLLRRRLLLRSLYITNNHDTKVIDFNVSIRSISGSIHRH